MAGGTGAFDLEVGALMRPGRPLSTMTRESEAKQHGLFDIFDGGPTRMAWKGFPGAQREKRENQPAWQRQIVVRRVELAERARRAADSPKGGDLFDEAREPGPPPPRAR